MMRHTHPEFEEWEITAECQFHRGIFSADIKRALILNAWAAKTLSPHPSMGARHTNRKCHYNWKGRGKDVYRVPRDQRRKQFHLRDGEQKGCTSKDIIKKGALRDGEGTIDHPRQKAAWAACRGAEAFSKLLQRISGSSVCVPC